MFDHFTFSSVIKLFMLLASHGGEHNVGELVTSITGVGIDLVLPRPKSVVGIVACETSTKDAWFHT